MARASKKPHMTRRCRYWRRTSEWVSWYETLAKCLTRALQVVLLSCLVRDIRSTIRRCCWRALTAITDHQVQRKKNTNWHIYLHFDRFTCHQILLPSISTHDCCLNPNSICSNMVPHAKSFYHKVNDRCQEANYSIQLWIFFLQLCSHHFHLC